jgi:hypothetical protein
MSARTVAAQRAVALAAIVPLLAMLIVNVTSAADPAPTLRRLDAGAARRNGVSVSLQRTPGPPAAILEVRAADGAQFAGRLLDVAPNGASAALAEALGSAAAVLVIARADGTQLRLEMPGLLAATFSSDGGRLAVVDGHGRLWAVDTAAATSHALAGGPFIDAPIVDPDGTTIALAVPSIEAPFQSRLVAIDPAGAVSVLSDEGLVYDALRLANGSLVAVAHRPRGTVLVVAGAKHRATVADLGPDAVNVSLSADGSVIAWESAGRIFVRTASGPPAEIGPGSEPAVAPDGASVLVRRDGGSALVRTDGTEIGRFAAASAFVECAGCAP